MGITACLAASREQCGIPEASAERDGRLSDLRKGWYWGSQAFRGRLLGLVGSGLQKIAARTYRSAPEVKEHHENAAGELLERGLSAVGATGREISHWSRSEPRKVLLAALLRRHTTVSNQWIADRLQLGSAANVSQRVRTADLPRIFRQLPETQKKALRKFF